MRKSTLVHFLLLGTASMACSSSSGSPETSVDSGTPPKKDTGTPDHFVAPHKDASKDTGVVVEKEAGKADVVEHDAPAKVDAKASDAGPEAGQEAGVDAGAPVPAGTALAVTQSPILYGITDDGYVIYATTTAVMASPVSATGDAGGAAATILTFTATAGAPVVQVIHDDVFVWANFDQSTYIATLSLWSHALGTAKQLSTTSQAFVAGASADSSAIVYTSASSSDGSTATLFGATTATLTSPATLVAGIDTTGACGPTISFTGTASPFYAVTGTCLPPTTDGGSDAPQVVAAYPSGTWTKVPLASSATSFWADTKGTSTAIAVPGGQLEIAPLAGGTPVLIDSATALATTPSFYLSTSDAFVLYATSAGALKTSSVTGSPAPTTLFAMGATDLDEVSPNEALVLVDTGFDQNTGLLMGLAFASTSTATTTPTAVVTGTNEAGLMGDMYTADSKYVIYTGNVTQDDNGYNTGALTAVAVAAPTTPITVATVTGSTLPGAVLPPSFFQGAGLPNTLTNVGNPTNLALTGSKIVYVDNFNSDVGTFGQVDLHVVDVSTTTASVTLMAGADPVYVVSADKKYLVYSTTFGASTDGIYAITLP